MYCYLNLEVAVGGGWKNFEEYDRKDLEQIVSRNVDVNDFTSEDGDRSELHVTANRGEMTGQQIEQKLYLVFLWEAEFVS